jgi:hypothetical protein
MLVGGRGELSPDPNWTVRGVVRAMARGFKDQPFALSAALIVLPGIWAAPATVLSSWWIPEAAREADTVPWWLDAGVLSASTRTVLLSGRTPVRAHPRQAGGHGRPCAEWGKRGRFGSR